MFLYTGYFFTANNQDYGTKQMGDIIFENRVRKVTRIIHDDTKYVKFSVWYADGTFCSHEFKDEFKNSSIEDIENICNGFNEIIWQFSKNVRYERS